jgi:hypothetical protein
MNSITCTKCGLVAFATTAGCKRCGAPYAPAGAGGFTQTFGGQSAQGAGQQTAGAVYYKPSGEVTLAGLASGVGGGLVAAVALGFAYAYLITYIPLIYLNILCVIGYALALGAASAALVRWGKMRNPAVGMCVALFVTLASYYVSWAVWLSIIVSNDEFSISSWTLAQNPLGLWGVLQLVNEKGAWSIGHGYGSSSKNNHAVSGVLLWVFWAAEALTVLIGSAFAAWVGLTSDPFCESCQTWCDEEKDLVSIQPADSDELKRRFEAKDFQYLKAVGPKHGDDAEWCRLDLHRCPGCGRTNTLSVKRESLQIDRKGKRTVSSKDVFRGLLLTEGEVHQLRQVSSELTRPQPVAA